MNIREELTHIFGYHCPKNESMSAYLHRMDQIGQYNLKTALDLLVCFCEYIEMQGDKPKK